jgi:hypothetical protein
LITQFISQKPPNQDKECEENADEGEGSEDDEKDQNQVCIKITIFSINKIISRFARSGG